MASSDHLASVDPWSQIRPGFLDPWIADLLSRDADSFAKSHHRSDDPDPISPLPYARPDIAPTPAASSVSASSDQESAPNHRPKPIPVAPRGRATKRKSRASKRSQTTFITADPANFRQMVQQITGVKFPGPHAPVLKPEAQRATGRQVLPRATGDWAGGCFLPNLDAATWRQDHPEGAAGQGLGPAPAAADSGMAGVLTFDLVGGFPTLESWKAI